MVLDVYEEPELSVELVAQNSQKQVLWILTTSIEIIKLTVGRSYNLACVHNHPTWMHLKACPCSWSMHLKACSCSWLLQVSTIVGSTMSRIFPPSYNPHAHSKRICVSSGKLKSVFFLPLMKSQSYKHQLSQIIAHLAYSLACIYPSIGVVGCRLLAGELEVSPEFLGPICSDLI